jgi:hypothetical protein
VRRVEGRWQRDAVSAEIVKNTHGSQSSIGNDGSDTT